MLDAGMLSIFEYLVIIHEFTNKQNLASRNCHCIVNFVENLLASSINSIKHLWLPF